MRRSPLKRRHQNSGRAAETRCCRRHGQWIRGHACAVRGCEPDPSNPLTKRIEAAHVRLGTDGGVGLKPSDHWLIPLCAMHHRLQHEIGETSFEERTGVKMRDLAQRLAAASEPLRQMERAR